MKIKFDAVLLSRYIDEINQTTWVGCIMIDNFPIYTEKPSWNKLNLTSKEFAINSVENHFQFVLTKLMNEGFADVDHQHLIL